MTKNVIDSIIRHEGFRSHVYLDSQGFLSLGYGTTVGRITVIENGEPVPLTLDRAVDLELAFHQEGVGTTKTRARTAVKDRVAGIRRELSTRNGNWWNHSKVRRDVLVEMQYQLGFSGLSRFVLMWAALDNKDYETAADEMLDSRWAKQTPERAEELAGIMRGAVA